MIDQWLRQDYGLQETLTGLLYSCSPHAWFWGKWTLQ